MGTLLDAETRRLYSWWWDSHVSPKNSKWLQENLIDIDAKVKSMIKLIEEDADSFARRAEMYYKKRPELLKLVEDFYQAYRALAGRYDHATGALRHAHRTMAEASIPSVNSSTEFPVEMETPTTEMPLGCHPDDLHKDALGISSSHLHAIRRTGCNSDESDFMMSRKGLKQLNELLDSGESGHQHVQFAPHHVKYETQNELRDCPNEVKTCGILKSENANKAETDIQSLKETLAKLEAAKDAALLQHQQALERLFGLGSQVSCMHDEAKGINSQASSAENEIQTTTQALAEVGTEREAGNIQYPQSLEWISNFEIEISHAQEMTRELNKQASKAESEAQNLKQALGRLGAEKEVNLLQYRKCLEMIHDLKTRISNAEDESGTLRERADRAETEVQFLQQVVAKLDEEKQDIALPYQQCLETISSLENEVFQAQEEARRLSSVIVMEVAKLSSAEEQYLMLERHNQSLQNEIDTLVQTMTMQTQELLDRHEEVQRLRIGIQEEHMHLMQAQNALRALQNLHSESQDGRALALQNQNGVRTLREMELRCQSLEEELQKVKKENNSLKEQTLSSSMLVKNLNDEILSLKEVKMKLEEEVEVHVYQRNDLQQDIYHLKEEIDELNRKNLAVIQQVESVGLKPDCLELSLKNLQEENLKLKEICQKNEDEEIALSDKSESMEKLLEMDVLLENFLSQVNVKLDELREKVKALEESCRALQREKSNFVSEKDILASQLERAGENVKKLSEKNTLLENSLFDANVKLDGLREKSMCAEESCQSLKNEKHVLLSERDGLISEIESIEQRLEDLRAIYIELEEKHLVLGKEKEVKIHQVEELQVSLNLEKQELANFIQLSESQLAHLDDEIHILQEECHGSKKAFEEEQAKVAKLQLEAFILQRCMLDVGEKNLSLLKECQKHFEASKLLQKLIFKLEQENLEKWAEVKSLSNRDEKLKLWMNHLSKLLNIDPDYESQGEVEEDETLFQHFVWKIEEMGASSLKSEDEKLQMLLEKSILITLLEELKTEAADLESQKGALHHELKTRTEELLKLQIEKQDLLRKNEQLISKLSELHEVIEGHKVREYSLVCDLQWERNEVKTWEAEAMTLFGDCQVTKICELLFEEKVHELIRACEFLEVERIAKLMDNEQLKEIQHDLECENEGMKSKFATYLPLIISLRDKMTYFESRLLSQTKIHEVDKQDTEVDELASYMLDKSYKEQNEDLRLTVEDGVSDLQELHIRIEAIEKAVFEMKRLMLQETVDTQVKLEAAMEEIKELKAKSCSVQEKPCTSSREIDMQLTEEEVGDEPTKLKLDKAEPETYNVGDGIFVKDIPLDQVSNCSSYDRGFDLRKISRAGVDEPAIELWEDAQQGYNLDLAFHEACKPAYKDATSYHNIKEVALKNGYSSSGLQAEKELSIDKLEVPKEVIEPNPEGNKRILERLGSDAQKLTTIEATFLDLKNKVERYEKSKKAKSVDYGTVKWQLKEIEEAIKQLCDVNAILMKNAKAESLSSDDKTVVELQENRKVRRRSVSELALYWSEKIGQVQLDLKRIQFLVLKLDDENKGKGTKAHDRKVLLRDYLYGHRQRTHRKKKAMFFSCIEPSDQSD